MKYKHIMKTSLILSALILISCSFKKPDPEGKQSEKLEVSSTIDSDGDGLKNNMDPEPFLADIPSFDGEMMDEVKLTARFYNRTLDKSLEVETLIQSSDEESVVKPGSSYLKNFIEDNSSMKHETVNFYTLPLSASDINLYSAPIITDELAHVYMAGANDLSSKGYILDNVEFDLRNRINLKSNRFKSFRDLIIEIHFYDHQTKKIEFIDSFKNVGSFEFNKDHHLDITQIKTRNTRVIDNSVLKAGKFLFVKIKDFYIPEIDKNYSELLNEVNKKTVPVLVNSPDGLNVFYVGSNGAPMPLMDLLAKSLGSDYETGEGKFIKYKDFPVGEFRVDTTEGERKNVLSKWHLVTNEINNNPFSYSFYPTDFLGLNYTKSSDPAFIASKVASALSNTKNEVILNGEEIFPIKTRKIKIILSSIMAEEPYLLATYSTRSGSGNGTCGPLRNHTGQVQYKHTSIGYKLVPIYPTDPRFLEILKYSSIVFDGFEYSLQKLTEDKKFSIKIDNENKVVLESENSFLKTLKSFGGNQVRFSMTHKRQYTPIEIGTYLNVCKCYQISGGPPPPGADIGCRDVQDRGRVEKPSIPLNYSFHTSLFVF